MNFFCCRKSRIEQTPINASELTNLIPPTSPNSRPFTSASRRLFMVAGFAFLQLAAGVGLIWHASTESKFMQISAYTLLGSSALTALTFCCQLCYLFRKLEWNGNRYRTVHSPIVYRGPIEQSTTPTGAAEAPRLRSPRPEPSAL